MCIERRRLSQTVASEWQTAFVVSHKMPWCALLTAVKDYNKSLEKLLDVFFKTETKTKTKTKCSRPRARLHDPRPRPRLSFLSSRRLETKTLVSRTTSLQTVLLHVRIFAVKIGPLASRLSKWLKVIEGDMDRPAAYDFKRSIVTVDVSHRISEMNGDFGRNK